MTLLCWTIERGLAPMCLDLGCGHGKVSRAGGTIVVSGRVTLWRPYVRYGQMGVTTARCS